MDNDAPKLGTGLFGYRRSVVQQIIAEGEARLEEAEGRLRAAESRVAELQEELESMRRRNAQIDEQIRRLRSQMERGPGRTSSGHAVKAWPTGHQDGPRPVLKEER